MMAIEETKTSTCIPVLKGQNQKTTADSPCQILDSRHYQSLDRARRHVGIVVTGWDQRRRRSKSSPTLGAKDSPCISASTASTTSRSGGGLICAIHRRISYCQRNVVKRRFDSLTIGQKPRGEERRRCEYDRFVVSSWHYAQPNLQIPQHRLRPNARVRTPLTTAQARRHRSMDA